MSKETQFLKKLESITMSTAERTRMRESLMAYADMHPLATTEVASPSYYSFLFAFMETKRFPLYASLMAVLLITSGGMTFAAERSAPGDSLYAVKVRVTEPLMSALSPSTEGQARVSARLATRRADEVVILASSGRLSDEKSAYLDTAFSQEIKKTVERTDSLTRAGNIEGAQEIRANLAVSLAGEAQALGAITTPKGKGAHAFLTKIVATSEEISGGVEHDTTSNDEVKIALPTQREPLLGTTTQVKQTKRAHSKEVRRTQSLFVTASTTLNGSLTTGAVLQVPKVDRAIQVVPPREVESTSELERGVLERK